MPSASEWSTYIRVFAVLIMIGGILTLISSIVNGYGIETYWGSLVLGIMYIIVGIRGFHAGMVKQARAARQYVVGLIVLLVLLIILNVINLPIALEVAGVCKVENVPDGVSTSACTTTFLLSALLSIGITLACCGCCIACGRSYYVELQREESFTGASYTTATPAYTTGAPGYNAPPYTV